MEKNEKKMDDTKKKLEKANKLNKDEIKTVKKQLEKAKNEVETTYKPATFSLIEVIVIILITGIVVSVCSGLIVFNNYDKILSNSSIEKDNVNEFVKAYNHIIESYVEKVDGDKLIDAAINGMYSYLGDSYSGYIDKDTTESLKEQLDGTYNGIGIEITSDETKVIITDVFKDSPAYKANLMVNDVITHINGVSYEGKTASDVSNAIKKSNDNIFDITIIRDGKEQLVNVKKDRIYINSVNSEKYDKTGYIQIETFSATTKDQVENKINEFDESVKNIIIDVRNNSGGYLNSAYEVADLFIEKNKVIYKLKDKNGKISNYLDKNKLKRKFDNIFVLINESSASASEILTAALDESADAVTIGKTTFGKGTVQETEILSSGAMIKHTTSYWLTPNGKSINNFGIAPDYEIFNSKDDDKVDNQLNKALELSNS